MLKDVYRVHIDDASIGAEGINTPSSVKSLLERLSEAIIICNITRHIFESIRARELFRQFLAEMTLRGYVQCHNFPASRYQSTCQFIANSRLCIHHTTVSF